MDTPKDRFVGDFISECIVVEPLTPIPKAIGLMRENESYEVFSQVGDKVGVVTVMDILKSKSPSNMKVRSLLNFVPKMPVDARILQAAKIMAEYRLRALPVLREGRIIGKVDVKSIVDEIRRSALGEIRASKIMTPTPVTISTGEKISKAREIMVRRKIDHLPVVGGKRVAGILTSSEIVFNMLAESEGDRYISGVPDKSNPLDNFVEAIMSRSPLECDPHTPIRDVAEMMISRKLSYSLITVGEEIQGIITYRDFAKMISAGEAEAKLPIYIVGLPEDPFEAEAAKAKFTRLVSSISKVIPEIIEARSTIKMSSPERQRRRYEVNVNIITAKGEAYNYSASGWDLPSIYDDVASSIKKTITAKRKMKRRKMREF